MEPPKAVDVWLTLGARGAVSWTVEPSQAVSSAPIAWVRGSSLWRSSVISARYGGSAGMGLLRGSRGGVAGAVDGLLGDWCAGFVDEGGNEADELEGDAGGVAELVEFVGGDVEDVAGFDGLFFVVAEDHSLAGEDEDFVFVVVLVFGGASAGGDDEFAHGEGGAAVGGAAEELHLHLFGALHGDGLFFDGIEVFQDHEEHYSG